MGHENDNIQSEGREKNAALPLDRRAANAGAERYPPSRKDDSVERVEAELRTPGEGNPKPRQGAGDS